MVSGDRGLSTVVDVALALLIVSASVLLVAISLHASDEPIDGDRGDRALQTLQGSTVTMTYDLRAANESGHAATDSEHFRLPSTLDPDAVGEPYRLTTYGSATALLAEAAMAKLSVAGTEPFAYGHDVEQSVEAAIRGQLVGSEGRIYAVATWEPYEGASVGGRATAGERPPRTADVSSASTEVSGSIPSVDAGDLADRFDEGERRTTGRSGVDDGFDAVGEELAGAIVEASFPAPATQYALESTLTENAVTVYDYRTLAAAVDVDVEDAVAGPTPDAEAANEQVRGEAGDDAGLAAEIADDLRDSPAGEELSETYDSFGGGPPTAEQRAALEAAFEAIVSVETVDVTVQVWDE